MTSGNGRGSDHPVPFLSITQMFSLPPSPPPGRGRLDTMKSLESSGEMKGTSSLRPIFPKVPSRGRVQRPLSWRDSRLAIVLPP